MCSYMPCSYIFEMRKPAKPNQDGYMNGNPTHRLVTTQSPTGTEASLKNTQREVNYLQRRAIRLTTDFSLGTTEAQAGENGAVLILRENDYRPRLMYPVEYLSRKWRDFATCRPLSKGNSKRWMLGGRNAIQMKGWGARRNKERRKYEYSNTTE